jgi:hypothetical protein
MSTLQVYDLAIAWNWEYDRGFISCLQDAASRNGISLLEICTENVEQIFTLLKKGEIHFRYFLDRASDESEVFHPLAHYVTSRFYSSDENRPRYLNLPDLQMRSADKATMHLEFLAHGIEVPYTIIISPYSDNSKTELSLVELAKLGRPFIIKPANTTGGGLGVVMGAETLKEVIDARRSNANDKYLLQETIKPMMLNGLRAWFRVFYAFGTIIPCWWDDITHVYSLLDENDEQRLGLEKLRIITQTIYEICKLEFFSTELVYVAERKCVAVDYVNEICDMRLQSESFDGVPDAVVHKVVSCMIEYVKRYAFQSSKNEISL